MRTILPYATDIAAIVRYTQLNLSLLQLTILELSLFPSSNYRTFVDDLVDAPVEKHTLGLVYGRRRIGKSTLLDQVVSERDGFYWEATQAEPSLQLARLGAAIGRHLGTRPLVLSNWEEAIEELLSLAPERNVPIVLDEFGYVIDAEPGVDSIIASAFGPNAQRRTPGRGRVILCGSAMALMSQLTAGEAPLRGRAGLELVMRPAGFREAASWLGGNSGPGLAAQVYAVIGGVIGYATDMVQYDLPDWSGDFERWLLARVLSPAATLHHEATTLLAEDPTLAASNPTLYHSVLQSIATGSVTAGRIANQLRRSVSSLEPTLKRLISTGFVVRHTDPVRAQRPTYALADPFLQFHYAILEPYRSMLRSRDHAEVWRQKLSASFDSHVRGPVFEEMARSWVATHADPETVGGFPEHVGPGGVTIAGTEYELDVVVAVGEPPDMPPSERTVLAIGEAKVGETVGCGHLRRLEQAQSALGQRAAQAKLLLFAPDFSDELVGRASGRSDIELVDLHRLYGGS